MSRAGGTRSGLLIKLVRAPRGAQQAEDRRGSL